MIRRRYCCRGFKRQHNYAQKELEQTQGHYQHGSKIIHPAAQFSFLDNVVLREYSRARVCPRCCCSEIEID